MKKYLKKIKGLFLSLLIVIGTYLTPFASSSAITTVNAEHTHTKSLDPQYVFDVVKEMTGQDLSTTYASSQYWWKVPNSPTYSDNAYDPTFVGNDVAHVTSDTVPSAYTGQTFDCVRTAMFIVGHALQKAGENPLEYFSDVGYNFNGNGAFTVSKDISTARTGDIIQYGGTIDANGVGYGGTHLGVVLGWKDGKLYTIDSGYWESESYGFPTSWGWMVRPYNGHGTSNTASSPMVGIYETPRTKDIDVNVSKTTLYPDCTNQNELYSLAGAIFSFYIDKGDSNSFNYDAVNEKTLNDYIELVKSKNMYQIDDVENIVRIITLYTCSYDKKVKNPEDRYYLHASIEEIK